MGPSTAASAWIARGISPTLWKWRISFLSYRGIYRWKWGPVRPGIT